MIFLDFNLNMVIPDVLYFIANNVNQKNTKMLFNDIIICFYDYCSGILFYITTHYSFTAIGKSEILDGIMVVGACLPFVNSFTRCVI